MLKRLLLALVLALQIGAVVSLSPNAVPPPRCFPCGN